MIKQNIPTCGIIIVTFNSQTYLDKAILSIKEQTHQSIQTIIVDTGSDDTSYLDAYCQDASTTVILAEKNSGFCKGNNIGIKALSEDCDFVFFLNPDAFISPTFVKSAIAFFKEPQHKSYGALTGKTLGYDIEAGKPTGTYDTTGIFRTWFGNWYDRGQGQQYNPGLFLIQDDIPAICGAVFFCRKKALDDVKIRDGEVFDNTFYMYKEDIDLSIRLRKKGWLLAFIPQLEAYHCRGWKKERAEMPKHLRLYSAKNELRIHLRAMAPIPIAYSLCKYAAVKLFDK